MGSSQLSATHTTKCAATSSSLNSIGPGSAEDSIDLPSLDPQVKDLLSKLTMETFDSISDQVIEWVNKRDGKTLGRVIQLVLERAIDDTMSYEMYAQLCYRIMKGVSEEMEDREVRDEEGKPVLGGQLFRRFLLLCCQDFFERIWIQKEVTAVAVASKNAEGEIIETLSKKKKKARVRKHSKESRAAQKANERNLAFVTMISELFRLEMLTEDIMHEQLKKLLGNLDPEEEDIKSLRVMLTKVGFILDTPKARARMDVYFQRIGELTKNPKVTPRLQSILQDVIMLRENNWSVMTPMTYEPKEHSRKVKEKHESERRKGRGKIVQLERPGTIGHGEEAGKLIGASGRDSQGAMSLGTLKKRPPPLNLDESPSSPDLYFTTTPAVRAIDDLERISYPEGISGPKRELNVNAKEGRFRYDREFLLQFMNICLDKPDKLPPLSHVGLGFLDQGISVQVLQGGSNHRGGRKRRN